MPFGSRRALLSRNSLLIDLISYWKLDEASGTRYDAHGTNHLAPSVSDPTQQAGKLGFAASFASANSQFLSVTDNASLSTGDIDFTFCAWVYLDALNVFQTLLSKFNSTGNQREHFLFLLNTNVLEFGVSNDGAATVAVDATTFGALSAAIWYFVCVWHDSVANTLNIQINNGTVDSAAHATGVFDSTSDFDLGERADGNWYWGGRIDGVGFWKRVLTADERTKLYNGGSGLDYPF